MATATITRADAAAELLRRRQARQHLLSFTQFTFPGYTPDPFHAHVAAEMDKVISGETTRLILSAAPQHGKSELASVRLPAFWLGRNPDLPVCIASYGADLARKKSRMVRDVIEGDAYQALFPTIQLRKDSRAVDNWLLDGYRGEVQAVGVDGPVTGNGFGLIIVDDPTKDEAEAQSQTMRDAAWTWYSRTLRGRLWEGGRIIVIATRWHEADLIGHLVEMMSQGGEQWKVLRYPAISETQAERDHAAMRLKLPQGDADPLGRAPGVAVAPSRYSLDALLTIKAAGIGNAWWAQYQGVPMPPEGGMFKEANLMVVESVPRECRRIRYWDKAGTEKGGAYSAGVLLAFHTPTKRVYVEDVVRGQWAMARREAMIRQTAEFDRLRYGRHTPWEPTIWVEQEPADAGKESAQATLRNLIGFTAYAERASGEKEVRAQPLASWAGTFNLYLLAGAWNRAYKDELTAAPTGMYWDQIDASSGAFNKIVRGGAWSSTY